MAKVQPLVAIFSAVDKVSEPVRKMQEVVTEATSKLDKTTLKNFNTTMKKAQRSFSEFKDNVVDGAKIAGVAIAAGLAGMAASSVSAIKSFDELGSGIDDNTKRLGVNAMALQEWRYAAMRTGSTPEMLDKALTKLNKTMQDVANGAGKDAKELFTKLGINIKNSDGTLRSATDVMEDLSVAFEKNENGALRTSMAMTLLGKSGTELIPLLAAGTQEFKTHSEEMRKYGLYLTDAEIEQATYVGDHLNRLDESFKIMKAKLGGSLAPAFFKISEAITQAFGQIASNKELLDSISKSVETFAKELASIDWSLMIKNVMQFFSKILDLVDALGGFKTIGAVLVGFFGVTKFVVPLISAISSLVSAFGLLKVGLIALKPVIMSLIGSTGIGLILVALGLIGVWIYDNWDLVKKWFNVALEAIQPFVDALSSGFNVALNFFKNYFKTVFEIATTLYTYLSEGVQALIGVYATVFGTIKNIILGTFETAYQIISSIVGKIVEAIQGITNTVSGAIDSVKNIGSNIYDKIAFWKDDEDAGATTLNAPNMMSNAVLGGTMQGSLDVNIKTQKGVIADAIPTNNENLRLSTNQGVLR